MVLAERTTESGVRNGRRSRGPSPNGHPGTGAATAVAAGGSGTTDSSSDEENSRKNGNTSKTTKTKSEYEEKIRVGRDYQAVCPELIPQPYRKLELLNDRALLVWSPTKEIPDNKLEEYITVAKDKYGYNGEQALGMLFWHKHDLERAVLDLANFTPFPDEWTAEDRVLFEQAFQFHGKSFHRIRQMLPDKSIASLVKFYYSWKKTRSRTSVMDRQEKMKKNDSSENGSDHGSNEESDNEDKIGLVDDVNNRVTVVATTNGQVAVKEEPLEMVNNDSSMIDAPLNSSMQPTVPVANALPAAPIVLNTSLSMEVDEVKFSATIKSEDATDTSNTVIIQ
ncbi:REST corepressor isoform X2 [Anopheles ziemanni]|uniref:REST corepressor isoform X4 n=1 Tax=Anopheles coustani TaxID=139045 RepID=UPI0026589581|nr:REST corepressor isoform X4 [Anopheles coustani]XP_058173757.1 REST corepressor isoform X2 [Anopheles ziemanni]